jgi:TolB-like protein
MVNEKRKKNQTITFEPLPLKSYGDGPFSVNATADSGLPTRIDVVGECKISSNNNIRDLKFLKKKSRIIEFIILTGAGSCKVIASQNGNAEYNAAPNATLEFNISKAAQHIYFDPLPNKTFGEKPFVLEATVSSGLPINIHATGNCTLKGNLVSITGVGRCEITASQSGNDDYNVANQVVRGFNIKKATQFITFGTIPNKTFGDKPFAVIATASSGLPLSGYATGNCTLNGNIVSITGAGHCKITALQEGNANYNAAKQLDRDFNIKKATQTITFGTIPNKTYGDKPFAVIATASSGLPLSGNASGNCTLEGNKVRITGAGHCQIIASQYGNDNYNAAISVLQNFNIDKADQSITFNDLADKTYGDEPFFISATASSPLSVSFKAAHNCTLDGNNNKVTITGAGDCQITASQKGNVNYNPAHDVVRDFNIGKATQFIKFAPLAKKTFADKPFTFKEAHASSERPVSYVAHGQCTNQGNKVTITGAGNCKITASQKGNVNYKPAHNVVRRFEIDKATQSITFAPLAKKTYGDKPFAFKKARASSNLPVSYVARGKCTTQGNKVTITGAGSCKITASQKGNMNYKAHKVVRRFDISKATQSITFAPLAKKTFGDKPFAFKKARASSNLPVSYVAHGKCTNQGNKVIIKDAGICQITASQKGNVNYIPAHDVVRRFDIGKATQSIRFAPLSNKIYGDKPFVLTTHASSNLSVSYVAHGQCTNQGKKVAITGAGNCQITASQKGNVNYNPAHDVVRRFEIGKATQSITFEHLSDKTFGDKPFVVKAEALSKEPVSFTTDSGSCTIDGNNVTIKSAGNCDVTAEQKGNANYKPIMDTKRIKIGKASQSIHFISGFANKTFGDNPFMISASASSGLSVSYVADGKCTIQGNNVTLTGAGICQITALQKGNANYKPRKDTKRIKIGKASQSINFISGLTNKTFGDKPFLRSAYASSGLLVNYSAEGDCTIQGNKVTLTGAGNCQITAKQEGNANYKPIMDTKRIYIDRASQNITFNVLADKTFRDKPFAVNAKADSLLPIHFEAIGNCSVKNNKVTITGAGSCKVSASQKGDTNYKKAKTVFRTFKIGKAPQKIIFGQLEKKTFGDKPFKVNPKADPSGLLVNLSVVGDCSYNNGLVNIKSIGKCKVTATQEGNPNYKAAKEVEQSFEIVKASQTITFNPLPEKTFSREPFAVKADVVSSGLPVSYVAHGNCTVPSTVQRTDQGIQVTLTGTGTCKITALQEGNPNYNAANSVSRSFEIVKATQIITFDELLPNKTFLDKPFALKAQASSKLPVSYVVHEQCTVQGNQVTLTGAGICQITAKQEGNANYKAAEEVARQFDIDKAIQTIKVEGLSNKTYGDKPFRISATASSGLLPVQGYAIGKCRLEGHDVTITGAGNCQITVSQEGNANYKAVPANYQHFFKIDKASQTITFEAITDKTYGDKPFAVKAEVLSNVKAKVLYNVKAKVLSELPVRFVAEGQCTVQDSQVTITGAGSCRVTAMQEGNANYEAAKSVIQHFEISKARQSISFEEILEEETFFGGNPFTKITPYSYYTTQSGLPIKTGLPINISIVDNKTSAVGKKDCTFEDNSVIITVGGKCRIIASQKGNENYEPAKTVEKEFNGKITQSIYFEALDNKTFGDKPFTVKAEASSKLPVLFRASGDCTVQGSQVTLTGAGSCQIMAVQKGNAKYDDTSKSRRFKIDKADQKITFDSPLDKNKKAYSKKPFSDKPFTVSATAPALPVLGYATGDCRLKGNQVTLTGVGSCQITALQEGNANYNAAEEVSRHFNISKGNQSIDFKLLEEKTYGNKPFTVSATAPVLPVLGYATGDCRLKGNQVTLTGAGSCQITALQEGNANYNAAKTVSRSFNIRKGSQSIDFQPLADRIYSRSNKAFAIDAKVVPSGLPVSFSVTGHCRLSKGNLLKLTGIGICKVTASQKGDDANYEVAPPVSQEFKMTKSEQSITFKALSYKAFVEKQFKLMAISDSGLPISYKSSNPVVATVKGDKVTMTGVGVTTITASQAGNAKFNAAKPVSQEMIVFTTHTGVIQTIDFNRGDNLVKVFLKGKPIVGAGSCQSYWSVNSLKNEKFMKFVKPNLVAAKSNKQRVKIWVTGCNGRFPKIYEVDLVDVRN